MLSQAEFDGFGVEVTERIRKLESSKLTLEDGLVSKVTELKAAQQAAAQAQADAADARERTHQVENSLREALENSVSRDHERSVTDLQEALRHAKRDIDTAKSALHGAALDKEREEVRSSAWVRGLENALNEARAAEAAKQDEVEYVRELAAAAAEESEIRIDELEQQLAAGAAQEGEMLSHIAQLEAKLHTRKWPNGEAEQKARTGMAQREARAAERRAEALEDRLEEAEMQLSTSQDAANLMVEGHNGEMAKLKNELKVAQAGGSQGGAQVLPTRTAQSNRPAANKTAEPWLELRRRGEEKAMQAAQSATPKDDLQSRPTTDRELARAAAQKSRMLRSKSPSQSQLKTESNRELAKAAAQKSRMLRSRSPTTRVPKAGAL